MPSVQITIFGRVQGVLFRQSTKKIADQLEIKGYAKNLPDGSVEIIAQGNQEQINQLEEWARTGPRLAKVDQIIKKVINLKEDFSDFSIQK